MGLLQAEGMASRLWNRMGASKLARTICAEAGFNGFVYTIGATEGTETEGTDSTDVEPTTGTVDAHGGEHSDNGQRGQPGQGHGHNG